MHATYNKHSDRLTIHDLDKSEYETLVTVFGFIGGHPEYSPRKHIDRIDIAINEAMGNAAINYQTTLAYACLSKSQKHSIFFNNYFDIERKQALAKLTDREKQLLGLK